MENIKNITIKNFTCFVNESTSFDKGINVLIGKNGVGKTHLLKLLYSHLHALESYTDISTEVEEKLLDSYFIEDIAPLKRGIDDFEISISLGDLLIESQSSKKIELSPKQIKRQNMIEKHCIYHLPR